MNVMNKVMYQILYDGVYNKFYNEQYNHVYYWKIVSNVSNFKNIKITRSINSCNCDLTLHVNMKVSDTVLPLTSVLSDIPFLRAINIAKDYLHQELSDFTLEGDFEHIIEEN